MLTITVTLCYTMKTQAQKAILDTLLLVRVMLGHSEQKDFEGTAPCIMQVETKGTACCIFYAICRCILAFSTEISIMKNEYI